MTSSITARPRATVVRRRFGPRGAIGLACLLAALSPHSASAVGLGPITQQSSLGQPLRVVVPLTLGPGEEIPSECFRIAAAERDADGIPQLLFGRVGVEHSPSGSSLVITNARTVSDPIVRLTIQAGCEAPMRREFTLFMDPPPIEAPVVATEAAPRDAVAAPPPAPTSTTRDSRRPRPAAQAPTRTARAPGTGDGTEAPKKSAPTKGRTAAKAAPKRPVAAPPERPRLSLSSGAPGAATGRAATAADREKAQQDQAAAIEAETQVLQKRIVELTALVERMQQEVRAQELAEQEAVAAIAKAAASSVAANAPDAPAKQAPGAAKAALPAPASDWWDDNAVLIAAIVLLPMLLAAALLWKRRRSAAEDDQWQTSRTMAPRTEGATESPGPVLRNPTAGLAGSGRESAATIAGKESDLSPATVATVDPLAVSELSHVTEEARVFVSLGHPQRAIEVLQEHLKRRPRSMPAAWLMLLSLHHTSGNRSEFRQLAEDFHVQFNVQTPLWEGFVSDEPGTGGFDRFPHVEKQLVALWRKPGCRAYLERLLYDNREGRRNGFPLATYADILMLLQMLDAPEDIDIAMDLVDEGSPDAAPAARLAPATPPEATAQARARRPMPPDPAASRPAQQPIRFDIEPPDSRNKPKS